MCPGGIGKAFGFMTVSATSTVTSRADADLSAARCTWIFGSLGTTKVPFWESGRLTAPAGVALPEGVTHPAKTGVIKVGAGTETELKALAGNIFSARLSRNRPLWDLTMVRGLQGNRTAMVARIHHALADGIAGVGMINVLMDPTPDVPRPVRKTR